MAAAEFSLPGAYLCLSPIRDMWEQPEDLPWAKPEKWQRQDLFEDFAADSSK